MTKIQQFGDYSLKDFPTGQFQLKVSCKIFAQIFQTYLARFLHNFGTQYMPDFEVNMQVEK